MMTTRYALTFLFILQLFSVRAQVCTNLGQNPATAFPVCGSSTFNQSNVAICGSRSIATKCVGALFQDKNPYWYKFTCFTAGTLGFVITPNNLSDDYDWQIFDITNRDPNDVYRDVNTFVACNWSGESGRTGASSAGTSLVVCDGQGRPLFSSMPVLATGRNYLLLVSHFTNTQSGYSLSFGGGTASITDTTLGKMLVARPNCSGTTVSVQLSKRLKCNSLAADGSDFSISPAANISSAAGLNCTAGFDMDSLVLNFATPLAPGHYTLALKNGSDGNTLLDNCNNPVAVGNSVNFTVSSAQPTTFDSITRVGCSPTELELVFSKTLLCSSIATDGSDFAISSSSGVTIVSASPLCLGTSTSKIRLTLSAPIVRQGTHQVTLKTGLDGNTITNECAQQTPAGSTVSFVSADTVSARFSYRVGFGCTLDTLSFIHPAGNGINKWTWLYPAGTNTQPSFTYRTADFTDQLIRLAVSNGTCSDSSSVIIKLDNAVNAAFTGPELVCPQDLSVFRDTSTGKIISWSWDFGNGSKSILQNPPIQNYPPARSSTNYTVRLIVQNDKNCFDTATRVIRVLNNCYIAVATAFTPNGDGLNDYLYPINAFKATGLKFQVFNRLGQRVFLSTGYGPKWDGTFKGMPQPSGAYVWTLEYTYIDTKEFYSTKGTSVLIR